MHLLLEQLVAVLQFLDCAGEIAQRREAVDARQQVGFRHLRVGGAGPQRARERSYEETERIIIGHFSLDWPALR